MILRRHTRGQNSILVVDDSLTVRMDLSDALTASGFEVRAVDRLDAARTALAEESFFLLILDVQLPDGSGVEFLEELRAQEQFISLRVMLLSAEAEVRDRIRGLKTAADDYVGKPYAIHYVVARAFEFLHQTDVSAERRVPLVLVVDDSRTFCEELRAYLESEGYAVAVAGSGEEALTVAGREQPDAAIVDVMLPGMRGEEVIRRFNLDPMLRKMPCILLTGSDAAADELSGLEAGADTYMRKSADLKVLGARLAALLRASSSRSARSAAGAAGGRKILAVDDSLTFLNELTGQLREDGYDVAAAHSGEEALELLPLERIDAILLDRSMPGLSGEDTCRRIKAHPDWRHIPVLMLTAADDQNSMISGLSAGADDYLTKSSSFEVVRARLRAQLRRKLYEDENRRVLAELARKELEGREAQAAHALAETRARLIADLEEKNKELEQARAEAEQAVRAKAAFLATMSHEIRTPLNAVIGISELLQNASLDERHKNLLGIIQTSGAHLLTVINDILDFSKIDAGKLELDRRPFSLRHCVEEALDLIAHKAAEKSLELAYVYGGDVPEGIVGDDNRIRQILVNYFSNAVKFTHRGEVVLTVEGRRCEDGQYLIQFAVRDTGIGIPVEQRQRLFKPFSQVDANSTRNFGGTGLGLAICNRLSEMMGGRTWVDSDVGKGSTFYFTIKGAPTELPGPALRTINSLSGLRLLVVDDNAINRHLLSAAAISWGMQVRETKSSLQALQWIRDGERFDLAFIDHLMPEMDGLALGREIHRVCHLPLVLVSSISSGFASGEFVAALSKPIRQSTLFDTVQDIVNRHLRMNVAVPSDQPPDVPEEFSCLRILLAEDNPVNQQVALLMLESFGCAADVVSNGEAAVMAAQEKAYDLVLMDVQMPYMDGLEATRRIRKLPLAGPEYQPFIVAMTAGAFESDRDLCMQAGMDDFAPKPIQRRRLAEVLRTAVSVCSTGSREETRAFSRTGGNKAEETPITSHVSGEREINPIVLDELAESLGSEGFIHVLDAFIEDAPQALESLQRAYDCGDIAELRRFAHSMGSNCAAVGASELSVRFREVELQAASGAIEGIEEKLAQASTRYGQLVKELQEIRENCDQ
jgi:DNA-binding response OmpR family regulator